MPKFRLDKKVRCCYCNKLTRTWAGLEFHLIWTHTIRRMENSIACIAILILCVVTIIIAEFFL